ncbi:hypothetical protein NDU88_005146 [Pleurodeles waltl]|uniref:Uncharacterized protein n=1 Tax=Pleurodeles waltl TaxID=8319 RepID=A0AAV7M952_PLEWA|nr:hypothetical protein NDU88_005146 [Pleurodeles waltl]
MRVPLNLVEPSRAELLAANQGSRVALDGKIETVAVEVNLLWADRWKVSEKVKVAEGFIVELQTEVGALRKQMVQANSTVGRVEASMAGYEDQASDEYYLDDSAGSFEQDLVYALDAGVRHTVNQPLAQATRPIKHHLIGFAEQQGWVALRASSQ